MKLKSLITLLFTILLHFTNAQIVIIKGNVYDNQNRKGLNGATIKVGRQATKTDKNGYFEINTPLKTVTELGINFSHVGYLNVNLIYQPQHVYQVYLTESSAELREVLIAPGDDIIKKAIKKIPENYPDKPTVIKGILRMQKWRNNSQYLRSDGIIKAYIPSYTSDEKTTVTVLFNKLDTIYDKTLKYMSNTGSYNVVEFIDIAHNKNVLKMLRKKLKLDYRLVGKQVYNNRKVFVINSVLQDTAQKYGRLEATLYIDTASYAFVAANLIYYNIPRNGPFIARKEIAQKVVYEHIKGKWYLTEVHSKNISEYKNEEPHSITDFIRTELDTNNVEKIRYKDIVQKADDVFLVDKPTNEEDWSKYSIKFKEAEEIGTIEGVPMDKLDTIKQNNLIANQNYKKPFSRKVYDYIRGDNIRSTFSVNKLPISIGSSSYDIPEVITYGVGFGADYRFYKSLFLGFQLQYNVPNSYKIKVSTIGLNVSKEFVLNRNARNVVLAPYLGINWITARQASEKAGCRMIDYGLRASYELNHKKALFVSSSFNSTSGSKNVSEFTMMPSATALGIGIVFKN